jgi:hypothetical protein
MSHSELWQHVKEIVEFALQFDVAGKLRRRNSVRMLEPECSLLTKARELADTRRRLRSPSENPGYTEFGVDEPYDTHEFDSEGDFLMSAEELEEEREDAYQRGVEYGLLQDPDDI